MKKEYLAPSIEIDFGGNKDVICTSVNDDDKNDNNINMEEKMGGWFL